jgi:hypothetical protein
MALTPHALWDKVYQRPPTVFVNPYGKAGAIVRQERGAWPFNAQKPRRSAHSRTPIKAHYAPTVGGIARIFFGAWKTAALAAE